eukprot:scaffold124014_cov27-Phaeocystis_antarctica.AAC.1
MVRPQPRSGRGSVLRPLAQAREASDSYPCSRWPCSRSAAAETMPPPGSALGSAVSWAVALAAAVVALRAAAAAETAVVPRGSAGS